MSYFKNIFTTGAVSKTPMRVQEAIRRQLPVSPPSRIIELGAGKGELTGILLDQYKNTCVKIAAFEINPAFSSDLKTNYPSIQVFTHNALEFAEVTGEPVDLLICSLPLSFFQRTDRHTLLTSINQQLRPGGKLIILFHAVWLIPQLKRIFPSATIKWFGHLPPYLLLTYTAN